MGHKPEMTPQKAAAYKRLAGMLDKICDEAAAEQAAAEACERCEGTGVLRGYHGEPCPPEFHEDVPCHHCNGKGRKQAAAPSMSDHQAEVKAKELWGVNGAAWHNSCARKDDLRWCQVGLRVGDVQDSWKVFGHGKDWAAAFLNAKHKGYCE